MPINTPTANSSYDSDVAQTVNAFVDGVTDALDSVDADCEVIEDVADAGDDVANAVEQEIREKDEEIEELQEKVNQEGDRRSAEIEGCHARISRVEGDIETADPTPESEETAIKQSESGLEQVCSLPEETAEENLTTNQQRARFVAKDISDYGRKVPAGIAIKSSEIRRVLTAAEKNSAHTQTVSRVMDFLDRLGGDEVEIKKTRSGENTVVFTEEIVDRITKVVIKERQPAVIETAI